MKNKIFLGTLVLLGLLGACFAWGGFFGSPSELPQEAKEQFRQAFEEKDFEKILDLREQYGPKHNSTESEEVISLREQIREAINSGDYEKAKELRGELRELLPEKEPRDFMGKRRFGQGGKGFGPKGLHSRCPCMQAQ